MRVPSLGRLAAGERGVAGIALAGVDAIDARRGWSKGCLVWRIRGRTRGHLQRRDAENAETSAEKNQHGRT